MLTEYYFSKRLKLIINETILCYFMCLLDLFYKKYQWQLAVPIASDYHPVTPIRFNPLATKLPLLDHIAIPIIVLRVN